MLCTKFQVFRSKTVTGSFRTYIHTYGQTYIHTYGQTYIHTYRGPKQGKPGRNRNSSQGSVLVSGHYWFVKQCWLVNITGLYRVQVSENYRFLPQRFNYNIPYSFNKNPFINLATFEYLDRVKKKHIRRDRRSKVTLQLGSI